MVRVTTSTLNGEGGRRGLVSKRLGLSEKPFYTAQLSDQGDRVRKAKDSQRLFGVDTTHATREHAVISEGSSLGRTDMMPGRGVVELVSKEMKVM